MQTKLKPIGITLLGLAIVLFFLSATTNPIFHITINVSNNPAVQFTFPGKTSVTGSDGKPHISYKATETVSIQGFVSAGSSISNVQWKMDQGAWLDATFINSGGQTIPGAGLYQLLSTRADNVGFWDHTINLRFVASGTTKTFSLAFVLDLEGPASPPTIKWVGLIEGQTVSGTLNLRIVLTACSFIPKSAKITDTWPDTTKHDSSMTRIEYPTWSPSGERWGFELSWDTTKVPDGTHKLDVYIVDPNNNLFGPYSIFAGVTGGTEPFWRNPLETVERAITFACSISTFLIGLVFLFIPMPLPQVGKHF